MALAENMLRPSQLSLYPGLTSASLPSTTGTNTPPFTNKEGRKAVCIQEGMASSAPRVSRFPPNPLTGHRGPTYLGHLQGGLLGPPPALTSLPVLPAPATRGVLGASGVQRMQEESSYPTNLLGLSPTRALVPPHRPRTRDTKDSPFASQCRPLHMPQCPHSHPEVHWGRWPRRTPPLHSWCSI